MDSRTSWRRWPRGWRPWQPVGSQWQTRTGSQRQPAADDTTPRGQRKLTPRVPAPRTGRPGIPPETLRAIAEARNLFPTLSLPQLAQHLFDAGIYRATGKDGQARPVDHSRLRRWLAQADAEATAEEPPS